MMLSYISIWYMKIYVVITYEIHCHALLKSIFTYTHDHKKELGIHRRDCVKICN